MGDIFDEIKKIANEADMKSLDSELRAYFEQLESAGKARDHEKAIQVLLQSPGLIQKLLDKHIETLKEYTALTEKYVRLLNKHNRALDVLLEDPEEGQQNG